MREALPPAQTEASDPRPSHCLVASQVLLRGRPLPLLGALTGLLGTLFGLGLALHAGGRVRVCSVADVFCWRLTTQALALWTFVVGLAGDTAGGSGVWTFARKKSRTRPISVFRGQLSPAPVAGCLWK